MNTTYYGTLQEANLYFADRLHELAWTGAEIADRPKALLAATRIIDGFNFKGDKSPVYTLKLTNEYATQDLIRAAELTQALEFPRGADTTVPEPIRQACYELAYALLDGRDPELELEALGISTQKYGPVSTIYSRDQAPIEHILNGVPSAMAWRLIRPFLRDNATMKLSKIS